MESPTQEMCRGAASHTSTCTATTSKNCVVRAIFDLTRHCFFCADLLFRLALRIWFVNAVNRHIFHHTHVRAQTPHAALEAHLFCACASLCLSPREYVRLRLSQLWVACIDSAFCFLFRLTMSHQPPAAAKEDDVSRLRPQLQPLATRSLLT